MKNICNTFIIPAFFLMHCFSGISQTQTHTQETWELNGANLPGAGNQVYVARDSIVLLPGFIYEASPGNTFTAMIDQMLVLPPTDNTYDPTLGGVVGAIPGAFDVSPTGAATYSIPIECPAGINGMQPNLSIVYNSQGGNGYMGWGWALAGLSSISRCGNTLHFDDNVAEIKLNASDNFMLDGQRLIRPSNNSPVFLTESESYTDITMKSIYLDNATRSYFEVKTKEGLTIEYGATLDSRFTVSNALLTWYISKVTDANENYMTYEYFNDNGEVRIHKIKYTGNAITGTLPVNEIEFDYIERLDKQYSYIQGASIPIKWLINSIKLKTNAEDIQQYAIGYDLNNINSKPTSITLLYLPYSNSTKYNTTQILWDNTNELHAKNNFTLQGLSNLSNASLYYANFSGKGTTDILAVSSTSDNFNVVYTLRFYNVNDAAVTGIINPWHTKNIYISTVSFISFSGITLGDFNGDGFCDFILSYKAKAGGSSKDYYSHDLYINTGNGNDFDYRSFLGYETKEKVFTADFDGDGKMDLIFEGDNRILFFEGNTFTTKFFGQNDIVWGTKHHTSDFYNNLYFLDFNGDGKTNLMTLDTDSCRIYTLTKGSTNWKFEKIYAADYPNVDTGVYFGDFNGDGKTDMITQKVLYSNHPDENETAIHFSTGTGFNQQIIPWLKPYLTKLFVGDYNGDGRSDVCLYSSGNAVFGISSGLTLHKHDSSTGNYYPVPSNLTISNFNGDGREELLEKTNNEISLYTYGKNVENLSVQKIKNGLGQEINISYAYLSNPDVYTLSNSTYSSPMATYTSKLKVASDYSRGDGASLFKTSMKYTHARIHMQGKGFLGFKEVESKDNTSNISSTTTYLYHSQHYFPYLYQQLTKYNSKQISSVDFQNTFQSSGKRFSLSLSKQTTHDYLSELSTITEASNPDDSGNFRQIYTQTGNNKETKVIEYIQKGAWCKNKPRKISITKEITGNPQQHARTIHYEYDNNGNLLKQIADSADVKTVVTEYKNYDAFGHYRKVEVTANGQTRRTDSLTYTPSGRFVANRTNLLNETVSYNWDETYGRLLNETSRMGVTSYQYDAMGRLTLTTYPDGIKTANVLQWAGDLAYKPTNAKYYSYTETSGQPPVWVWYDALSREIRKDSYGLNNKKVMVDTEYNPKGQVSQVSEPYFEENVNSKTWAAAYTYNNYGQVSNVHTPMGDTQTTREELFTYITSPEGVREIYYNTAGQVIEDRVNDKSVAYTYYPSGLVKTATPEGGQAVSMEYDLQGNRTKLTDPDAGVITSKYDGWGQLVREAQRIHDTGNITDSTVTVYNYLSSGLLNYKLRNTANGPNEKTSYGYDNLYRLKWISIAGKHAQGFVYDQWDRIIQVNDTVDGSKVFVNKTEYDLFGRVKKESYPTGYYTLNQYDKYSCLTEVNDKNGSNIWKALEENAKGQLTKSSQGGHVTTFGFDSRGFPTSVVTPGINQWNYIFDNEDNLLVSRRDVIANCKDSLTYDALNRLKSWKVYQGNSLQQSDSISYNPVTGNISSKSDLGNYTFNYGANGKPHALTSISGVPTQFPLDALDVTYTDFKKIKTLTEGNKTYTLSYGVDEQRTKSVYAVNGAAQMTRYYLGNYEEEVRPNGSIRKIHYLPNAVYIQNNGNDSLLFIHRDYLGSLVALTDTAGNVLERYAFDPWGNRRNPTNWAQSDSRTSWLVNRGFTMHEHLDAFGIINMNGRVYDPLTALFFSPDPYLQAPGDWLNYNRYSYCHNNPLIYTDPSGEFFFSLILPGIGTILDAACWGAVFSGGLYTVSVALSPGGFNNWSWKDFGYSCLNGAINGAISGGMSMLGSPLSMNIGGGFSIGLQPNLMISSNGMGFGANVGLDYGITSWMKTGVDIGFNHYFMTTGTEKQNQQLFTFGYGLEFGNKKNNVSLYSTHYAASDGSSQRVGGLGMNFGKFNFRYENDGAPPFWGIFGDNKDQFRTAAAQIGWGDLNLRLNMMTGSGSDNAEVTGHSSKYPYGYYKGGGVDNVRFGALSLGYKGYRIGANSEGIRHTFQNRIVHNAIGQAGFKQLDNKWHPYYYWGTTNRYSLWY